MDLFSSVMALFSKIQKKPKNEVYTLTETITFCDFEIINPSTKETTLAILLELCNVTNIDGTFEIVKAESIPLVFIYKEPEIVTFF